MLWGGLRGLFNSSLGRGFVGFVLFFQDVWARCFTMLGGVDVFSFVRFGGALVGEPFLFSSVAFSSWACLFFAGDDSSFDRFLFFSASSISILPSPFPDFLTGVPVDCLLELRFGEFEFFLRNPPRINNSTELEGDEGRGLGVP